MGQTLIPFFLYGIPESFLLILAALGLLGIKARPRPLITAGLGLSLVSLCARHFLFSYNLHTPVVLIGLVIALLLIFKLSLTTAVIGCFFGFFLDVIGSLLATLILRLADVTLQETLINPWLQVAFGWLSASALLVTVAVTKFGRVALIKVPEAKLGMDEPGSGKRIKDGDLREENEKSDIASL